MAYILHLVQADVFRSLAPGAAYRPSGFETDGFIHCTREPEVLLQIANALYNDTPGDFVALLIDEHKVSAPVIYESPAPAGGRVADAPGTTRFPHIYGQLNQEAIVDIVPVVRAADGRFTGYMRTWPSVEH